jgi:glycosyltransferase involved in cell wall biosynthesis
MKKYKYALITAAYNEECCLERTINSVLAQSILPSKWVIVSDNSEDGTDEIIKKYAKRFNFILYMRKANRQYHNFCSKVYALRQGYNLIRNMEFDFIGNLDADILLPNNYYERLIELLNEDYSIGIGSGIYVEINQNKIYNLKIPPYHTPGSIQFFRRECFQQIGGYPLINGGEDTAAGVLARMNGWKTMSLNSLEAIHLKPIRIGKLKKILKAKIRLGGSDYNLGMHPHYATIKFLKHLANEPYLIGGITLYLGYLTKLIKNEKREVSKEFIKFFRQEQKSYLRNEIQKLITTFK